MSPDWDHTEVALAKEMEELPELEEEIVPREDWQGRALELEEQVANQEQTIVELYDDLLTRKQDIQTKEKQLNLIRDQLSMWETYPEQVESLSNQLDEERGQTLLMETQLQSSGLELKQLRANSFQIIQGQELADEFGRLYQEARIENERKSQKIDELRKNMEQQKREFQKSSQKIAVLPKLKERYLAEKELRIDQEKRNKKLKKMIDQQREAFVQLEKTRNRLEGQLKNSEQLSFELLRQSREGNQIVAFAEPMKAPSVKARKHIVQRGETLSSISLQHYGTVTKWGDIFEANRGVMTNQDRVYEGLELRIP